MRWVSGFVVLECQEYYQSLSPNMTLEPACSTDQKSGEEGRRVGRRKPRPRKMACGLGKAKTQRRGAAARKIRMYKYRTLLQAAVCSEEVGRSKSPTGNEYVFCTDANDVLIRTS